MPRITRWFLKSALIYLVCAIGIEILAAWPSGPVHRIAVQLRPSAFHFFFVGWLSQMVFGVSHWLFPIFSRSEPRGKQWLIDTSFVALNIGIVLRFFSEAPFWQSVYPGTQTILLLSIVLQWVGFVAYAAHIWPRIKLKGHG